MFHKVCRGSVLVPAVLSSAAWNANCQRRWRKRLTPLLDATSARNSRPQVWHYCKNFGQVFSLILFSDTRVKCKYLYSGFIITQAWINIYFVKKEVLLSKKEYTRFKVLMEMSVHRTHVLLIIFCSWDFLLCVFFTYTMNTFLSVHPAIWH